MMSTFGSLTPSLTRGTTSELVCLGCCHGSVRSLSLICRTFTTDVPLALLGASTWTVVELVRAL